MYISHPLGRIGCGVHKIDVYGLPCIVAINHRAEDSPAELHWLMDRASHHGVKVIVAKHYAEGSQGAVEDLPADPRVRDVRLAGEHGLRHVWIL